MDRLSLSDALKIWREHGGSTYGPRVEHVSMKEADFVGFCEALVAARTPSPMAGEADYNAAERFDFLEKEAAEDGVPFAREVADDVLKMLEFSGASAPYIFADPTGQIILMWKRGAEEAVLTLPSPDGGKAEGWQPSLEQIDAIVTELNRRMRMDDVPIVHRSDVQKAFAKVFAPPDTGEPR